MSQSVLVMDTPNTCLECIMLTETHECIMQSKEANYNAYSYTKLQEGCPLKPMPEKKIECAFKACLKGCCEHGWNACIDAITGGKNND